MTGNGEGVLPKTFPRRDAVVSGEGFAMPGIIYGPHAPARRQMRRHFEVTTTVKARCMRNEERFPARTTKMVKDERRPIRPGERKR